MLFRSGQGRTPGEKSRISRSERERIGQSGKEGGQAGTSGRGKRRKTEGTHGESSYMLHTILILSIFLLILFFIDYKSISIKYIYYILLFFILYTSVYGSIGSIEKSIPMESYNLLSFIFFALTFFYFGCLILTPEKTPLNPLDYILLAFILLLILILEGQNDPYKQAIFYFFLPLSLSPDPILQYGLHQQRDRKSVV